MKKRLHLWIALGILVVGLVLGSFFDLQINQALFNKTNVFGLIVSSFGMIPGYGCLSLLGGALFYITLKDQTFKKWLKVLLFGSSAAMFGTSIYFLGKDVFSVNGFENKKIFWLGFVIMGVIMCGVFYLGILLGKMNENPKMWIIILIVAAAIFMALVPGVTLFKAIMHRPRYRFAIYEGYVDFHNWWEPFKEYDTYKDMYAHDNFKSFPSGHTAEASILFATLTFLPLANEKYKKLQMPLFYCSC